MLAVLTALVLALTLLILGAYKAGLILEHILRGELPKLVAAAFIDIADLLLLGVVMYIIALGLYELFIDDTVPVPHWLEIHSLEDLKIKLISVVIVVMGVDFLKQMVSWEDERNLLTFGGGIALVIDALTYFLSSHGREKTMHMEK